jgi:hypothetical protein
MILNWSAELDHERFTKFSATFRFDQQMTNTPQTTSTNALQYNDAFGIEIGEFLCVDKLCPPRDQALRLLLDLLLACPDASRSPHYTALRMLHAHARASAD